MAEAGCGVGEGHHDRQDLAACLADWDRLEAAYVARIEAVCRRPGPWRERFRAACLETVGLVEEQPDTARFFLLDVLSAGEQARHRQHRLASRLATLLDTAREELDDPTAPPKVTAHWILSVFRYRIQRRLLAPDGPSLSAQLPELMFLAISCYFGMDAGLAELHREP